MKLFTVTGKTISEGITATYGILAFGENIPYGFKVRVSAKLLSQTDPNAETLIKEGGFTIGGSREIPLELIPLEEISEAAKKTDPRSSAVVLLKATRETFDDPPPLSQFGIEVWLSKGVLTISHGHNYEERFYLVWMFDDTPITLIPSDSPRGGQYTPLNQKARVLEFTGETLRWRVE